MADHVKMATNLVFPATAHDNMNGADIDCRFIDHNREFGCGRLAVQVKVNAPPGKDTAGFPLTRALYRLIICCVWNKVDISAAAVLS